MSPKSESAQLAVHQNLVIERILRRRTSLKVRLRHPSGASDWVTYHVPFTVRDEYFFRLAAWRENATALTYVRVRGNGVLVDDQAFFRAAFAPD